MVFRRIQSVILLIIAFSFLMFIEYSFLNSNIFETTSIIVCLVLVYLLTTNIEIRDQKLIKKTLYFWEKEIEINSIRYIEAITVTKAGYAEITIGRSNREDFYILYLTDHSQIKVDASYRNKGRTLGRYLKMQKKIKFKEIERVKYLY